MDKVIKAIKASAKRALGDWQIVITQNGGNLIEVNFPSIYTNFKDAKMVLEIDQNEIKIISFTKTFERVALNLAEDETNEVIFKPLD